MNLSKCFTNWDHSLNETEPCTFGVCLKTLSGRNTVCSCAGVLGNWCSSMNFQMLFLHEHNLVTA